jgi:hypothetical protein
MTAKTEPSDHAKATAVDTGRRQALKQLRRAAYVAPAIAVLPMEKLLAAASSTGCDRSGGSGRGC